MFENGFSVSDRNSAHLQSMMEKNDSDTKGNMIAVRFSGTTDGSYSAYVSLRPSSPGSRQRNTRQGNGRWSVECCRVKQAGIGLYEWLREEAGYRSEANSEPGKKAVFREGFSK